MDIYTKTGDKGTTKLFTDQEVSKDHIRVEAYGTIDELGSFIGWAKHSTDDEIKQFLEKIQNELFVVGGHLASEGFDYPFQIVEQDIIELEKMIDKLKVRPEFPPLEHFIIPGSTEIAGRFHIARTVCRRAERRMITLSKSYEFDPLNIKYVNRLSDVLYTIARLYETEVKYVEWD